MEFSRRKLIKYLISIGAVSSIGALGYIKFKPISIQSRSRAKVVIIGLGSHGIALANYLRRFVDNLDIIAIDKSKNYRKRMEQGLDLARGLVTNKVQSKEEMLKLEYQANSNFRWYEDSVVAIDPNTNRIQTQNNGVMNYDALVLAPGIINIENELAKIQSNKIGSFYFDFDTTVKTLQNIKRVLKANQTVSFYYPANPTASRAHFFENILMTQFLTAYFQSGRVKVISADNVLHPVPIFNQTLDEVIRDLSGIDFQKNAQMVSLNLETNQIVFQSNQTQIPTNLEFLCYVPEARVANFVGRDLLMNSRFIPVDQNTLQHRRYTNVFALGDAADLNVEKSLSSISEQVSVVAKNLIAYLDGKPLIEKYDGYTVFSMITAKQLGYYWERNYSGVVKNNFYSIEVRNNPTRQQKIALTAYTQAKYKMALLGILV